MPRSRSWSCKLNCRPALVWVYSCEQLDILMLKFGVFDKPMGILPGRPGPFVKPGLIPTGGFFYDTGKTTPVIQRQIPAGSFRRQPQPGRLVADEHRPAGQQRLEDGMPEVLARRRQYKNMMLLQKGHQLIIPPRSE